MEEATMPRRLVPAMLVLMSLTGCGAAPPSRYPVVVAPREVGRYPTKVERDGEGRYDDVLEYRVWVRRITGDRYFEAFPTFEAAAEHAEKVSGSEPPTVLVRQREYPRKRAFGRDEVVEEERLTEWKPSDLAGRHRTPEAPEGAGEAEP